MPKSEDKLTVTELLGTPILIISRHDDGEQRRKHKKRRINKKWLKRYGVYHVPIKPNSVIYFQGRLMMTYPTYLKLKNELKEKGVRVYSTKAQKLKEAYHDTN